MTDKREDGGLAFPAGIAVGPAGDVYLSTDRENESGMSLRDWFAGMALNGICYKNPFDTAYSNAAKAYENADAMLRAREGGEGA